MAETRGRTDPSEIRKRFPDPLTLAASEDVPQADRIRALLDWKQDLLELQKAGEENMPDPSGRSNVAGRLKAVSDALISLGHESD
jgi:hypothetical protein